MNHRAVDAAKHAITTPDERLSFTYGSHMRSASGGRVQRSEWIEGRCAIAAVLTMRPSGRVCMSWPLFAGGSTIDGFIDVQHLLKVGH